MLRQTLTFLFYLTVIIGELASAGTLPYKVRPFCHIHDGVSSTFAPLAEPNFPVATWNPLTLEHSLPESKANYLKSKCLEKALGNHSHFPHPPYLWGKEDRLFSELHPINRNHLLDQITFFQKDDLLVKVAKEISSHHRFSPVLDKERDYLLDEGILSLRKTKNSLLDKIKQLKKYNKEITPRDLLPQSYAQDSSRMDTLIYDEQNKLIAGNLGNKIYDPSSKQFKQDPNRTQKDYPLGLDTFEFLFAKLQDTGKLNKENTLLKLALFLETRTHGFEFTFREYLEQNFRRPNLNKYGHKGLEFPIRSGRILHKITVGPNQIQVTTRLNWLLKITDDRNFLFPFRVVTKRVMKIDLDTLDSGLSDSYKLKIVPINHSKSSIFNLP